MRSSLSIVVSVAAAAGILLGSPGPAPAGDWPQWRGPHRTGVSTETGLLKSWPEGGPKLLWLFRDAGVGYSSFAVVGGRLYTMGARGETERLLAIDVEDGTEIWAAEVGPLYEDRRGDGPRGTPAVDGDAVFAMGGQGSLICAAASDGAVRWRRSMRDLGGRVPGWGYAESVLVDGDRVICTPGGRRGAVAALDRKSGDVIWQSKEFTDGAHYSSTISIEHGGVRQYVQLTKDSIAGIAAKDGELLWRSEWPGQTAVVPTPIFHDGRVYVTSGYGVGCKLVELVARDGGHEAEEVYRNHEMKNHHGGVVLVDGHLYGFSDDRGWVCQNFLTGETVWRERGNLGKGTLTCADDMLYCLDERDGTVALVEASPEGWSEHGRFRLSPQSERRGRGRVWTHPVVSDGRLYLRDQEFVFCYDVKAK